MTELDEWAILHRYNKVVRRGGATALECRCGAELIPKLIDNSMYFWCPSCDTRTAAGLALIRKLDRIAEDYFRHNI